MSAENPVRTLNAEVARKIAAGEVIDRPNAIVRELLDNAIDSGADSITVEISGGGIEKIRVIDNGCGMTKEDLQNCARPHATSKISTEVDLMKLSTLGFRGEALASIAAVGRLSIMSSGWKMRSSITEDHIIEPAAEIKGTIVMSEGLFENFPARRQFLKRAATEGVMCKNTFIEKAMARPDIAFRFISDGETKIDLPAGQTLKDRFISANSYSEDSSLFFEISKESEGSVNDVKDWSFQVVVGEPAVSRSNKKDIFIYANGRRIQEYSLVQAVEYGGQGFFPNGTYPVAAVFVQVNPEKVDFNIHPAKREARFYDISDLHHGLSSTIKNFFHTYTYQNFKEDQSADSVRQLDFADLQTVDSNPLTSTASLPENLSPITKGTEQIVITKGTEQTIQTNFSNQSDNSAGYEKHISYKIPDTGASSFSDYRSRFLGGKTSGSSSSPATSCFNSNTGSLRSTVTSMAEQALSSFAPEIEASEKSKIRFIGNCLGTFLLAEKNNTLYFIDQHAAHERILFDKIMHSQGGRQPLLIPYKIKTESKTQDNQLEKLQEKLIKIGFDTQKISDGNWEITSIPERWTGTEYDLRSLLFVKQVEPEEIIRSIAAMTACKAAVKDGYVLDEITSARLVEQAFQLEDPHCPHGRPIYTVISREKLFELVKRT